MNVLLFFECIPFLATKIFCMQVWNIILFWCELMPVSNVLFYFFFLLFYFIIFVVHFSLFRVVLLLEFLFILYFILNISTPNTLYTDKINRIIMIKKVQVQHAALYTHCSVFIACWIYDQTYNFLCLCQ